MSRTVSQRELRNESGEIMRALDRGEDFIVTRNGIPVGQLRPLAKHRFVSIAQVFAVFDSAPSVSPEGFRADLDSAIDQDPSPRA